MKKVLYTGLSLVTAAILALVIVGLFMDEVEYTATIRVDGSMDEVWALFVDNSRRAEWLEGFVRAEQLSGDPMDVGSESRHFFESGSSYIETVLSVEPHQRIATEIATDVYSGSVTTTFQDQGDRIRVQQHTILSGDTFFWRAALPLFKPLMQRQMIDSLDRMADLVEKMSVRPNRTNADAP